MCCCNQNGNANDDLTIYGTQFTSSKDYENPLLKSRYRLYLRGVGFLTKGVEWSTLTDGGFGILIPGWAVTSDIIVNIQFY